jgi:putative acetyltransferase
MRDRRTATCTAAMQVFVLTELKTNYSLCRQQCRRPSMFEIHEDDLSGEATRDLLRIHLEGMHAASPPGSVFALDLSGLKTPQVTVWSVRQGDHIVGIGALKALGEGGGEIKSMRTHPDHLRKGVAAFLLDHLIVQARARDWNRLSLETGRGPVFEPALALYRSRGFVPGAPFGDYQPNPFSQFFHLPL